MSDFLAFVSQYWGAILAFCGFVTATTSFWLNIQNARNAKAQREKALQDLHGREKRIIPPTLEEIERYASPFARSSGGRGLPLIMAFLFAGLMGLTFYQSSRLAYVDDKWPRALSQAERYRFDLDQLKHEHESLATQYRNLQNAYGAANRPEKELAEENQRLKEKLKLITERLNALHSIMDDAKQAP